MATSDQHHSPDRADSFSPTHGPPRSKLAPLLLTILAMLVVLAIFAFFGWMRYNTG
jgi:hypothetical protein